jgi:prokaryotic ubiquitin-like protein Pup
MAAKGGSGGGEQKRIQKHKHGDDEGGDGQAKEEVVKKGEELKEDIDDLLDEIDEVLEENAEEFIRSYVQKGGE